MPINIRHIRLHNQHLLASKFKDPVEVVKSLVAVQAQDYYGAKWALAQRTVASSDDDVEKAFADGRILRLHIMRPTWHFVAREDIRWLLQLTAPRINAVSAHAYRQKGLDQSIFKRTHRALTKALRGGRELTRAELRLVLERAGIDPGDSICLGYIMIRAELDGVVCSGARRGNQFTYALLDERAPKSRMLEPDEALAELTERYFLTRGPATVKDFVWWSGLTVGQAKRGLDLVDRSLKNDLVETKIYFSGSKTTKPPDLAKRAHLLPAYDEYFISYKDRSAGMHPKFNQKTTASKLIFDAPLVIEGVVVGGWNRVVESKVVRINLKPFYQLNRAERNSVMQAVDRFAKFLGKDVSVNW